MFSSASVSVCLIKVIMLFMHPQTKISLSDHSTMGLGGVAEYLIEVTTKEELRQSVEWAKHNNLECIVIGKGSNIVWREDGFNGLVIVNNILNFEISPVENNNYLVSVGSGEIWDKVVEQTVDYGLTGIEALSLIPGTAGATPVQNVGAYGQEVSQTLEVIDVYDSQAGEFISLSAAECGFGYRTSRFKTSDHGRFYIYNVSFRLAKDNPKPPFYESLESYLRSHNINIYTPLVIRQAVISIRSSKLPDPSKVNNVGSFFANPIIPKSELEVLTDKYEKIPHWDTGEGLVKVSAAWLIDQAGFRDSHDQQTGMATWANQPLVLVNEHAKTTADLLAFKQKIVDAVEHKFNITLTQEPELLP